MKTFVALAGLLLLTACGSPSSREGSEESSTTESSAPVQTSFAGARPDGFAQCAACHAVAKGGPNGLGPNLWGVAGTKAGELAGYQFSPALKASGIVWDEESLNKWLENPRALVPGNKMSFSGIRDEAKRKELVTWLLAQK
ncbi:MAG: c-type cytochrome [Chakrabartia sp.]